MKPPLAQFQSDKRKEREHNAKLARQIERMKEMENQQRQQNHEAVMQTLENRHKFFGTVTS